MKVLAQLMTLYAWGSVCILLLFLFRIARFFEQRLSEKTGSQKQQRLYPLFLPPIVLYVISALFYAFGDTVIVGNLWGDVFRISGGIIFIYAGYSLINTMVGGRS